MRSERRKRLAAVEEFGRVKASQVKAGASDFMANGSGAPVFLAEKICSETEAMR
jgi:hypothetical protein